MESTKTEVVRRYIKYIFLDVVGFSKHSAEAQSDIVNEINEMVRQVLSAYNIEEENSILIPAGDGICIALVNPRLQFDIHIQIALKILALLDMHNKSTTDETRKFKVRIGINQNTDIIVSDVNGRRNVAGAGVNMASRIMEKADGNQILVSQTVYEELHPSEQYMNKFHKYEAVGKHDLHFNVYQYLGEGHDGLSLTMPTVFIKKQIAEVKLTKIAAYYFAHAIRNRKFVIDHRESAQTPYSIVVIYWILARDSMGESEATDIDPYNHIIYGTGNLSLAELVDYYNTINFRVISTLSEFILERLSPYGGFLDSGGSLFLLLFVNEKGVNKLKKEWPEIWEEFSLDQYI